MDGNFNPNLLGSIPPKLLSAPPTPPPYKPRFTIDILSIAKPIEKGIDGDWERVFALIDSNSSRYTSDFLKKTNPDDNGKTLLHYACTRASRKVAEDTVKKIFEYCSKYQMNMVEEKIAFVNQQDADGNTALQLATKKRNKSLVKLLLENGAAIDSLKKSKNIEGIHMIYDHVLKRIFDQSITIKKDPDDETNESVWEIDCDFAPITGLHNPSSVYSQDGKTPLNQTSHLARVLQHETASASGILLHPLVQIFLYFKGKKYFWLLFASMAYHILWSLISFAFIFCNTHILESTNINETSRDSNLTVLCVNFQVRFYETGNATTSSIKIRVSAYFCIMMILYFFSVGKEAYEFISCPDKWYYWKQLENLGQWVVNITILIVLAVAFVNTQADESLLEKSHFIWIIALPFIYIFGMFASLLLIQGQFKKTRLLGIYTEMFAKAFQNIIKFLVAFLPLLCAFMITFHLLMPTNHSFLPSWGLGLAKILAMMTGEVDYDDVFYGEDEEMITFKNILKILFLVFVITVVILLQNLLIGVTVSDVQKLEKTAKLNHLESQLEDIYLMENIVTKPWTVKILKKIRLTENWLKKHFTVDKSDSQIRKNKKEGSDQIRIRNMRLDEYPVDIRRVLMIWDKAQFEKKEMDTYIGVYDV